MVFIVGSSQEVPWDPVGSRGCIMGSRATPCAVSWVYHGIPRHAAEIPWDPAGIPMGSYVGSRGTLWTFHGFPRVPTRHPAKQKYKLGSRDIPRDSTRSVVFPASAHASSRAPRVPTLGLKSREVPRVVAKSLRFPSKYPVFPWYPLGSPGTTLGLSP